MCGTAVCHSCSKFFVKIPEYAYYDRVRVCKNCLEQMYKKSKAREEQERTRLMIQSYMSGQASFNQQSLEQFKSDFESGTGNNFKSVQGLKK